MPVEIKTQDVDRIVQQLGEEIAKRTNQATQLVRNDAVQALNRSQPTRRTAGGRIVGLDPSKPGEPPKRVSSRLLRDVQARVERTGTKIRGLVFTTVKYSRLLELGGARVAARPFLRPAFKGRRQAIRELLGGEVKLRLPRLRKRSR